MVSVCNALISVAVCSFLAEELFDAVVCCEDVVNGKPAPDLFLEAARRLNIDPNRCVAFEDADKVFLCAQQSCEYSALDSNILACEGNRGNRGSWYARC